MLDKKSCDLLFLDIPSFVLCRKKHQNCSYVWRFQTQHKDTIDPQTYNLHMYSVWYLCLTNVFCFSMEWVFLQLRFCFMR